MYYTGTFSVSDFAIWKLFIIYHPSNEACEAGNQEDAEHYDYASAFSISCKDLYTLCFGMFHVITSQIDTL